ASTIAPIAPDTRHSSSQLSSSLSPTPSPGSPAPTVCALGSQPHASSTEQRMNVALEARCVMSPLFVPGCGLVDHVRDARVREDGGVGGGRAVLQEASRLRACTLGLVRGAQRPQP